MYRAFRVGIVWTVMSKIRCKWCVVSRYMFVLICLVCHRQIRVENRFVPCTLSVIFCCLLALARPLCQFQALSTSDLSYVTYVCKLVAPELLFSSASQCPLSQQILLSLIQQLASDLKSDLELKTNFLVGAVSVLDPSQAITSRYGPNVMQHLCAHIDAIAAANPQLATQFNYIRLGARSIKWGIFVFHVHVLSLCVHKIRISCCAVFSLFVTFFPHLLSIRARFTFGQVPVCFSTYKSILVSESSTWLRALSWFSSD